MIGMLLFVIAFYLFTLNNLKYSESDLELSSYVSTQQLSLESIEIEQESKVVELLVNEEYIVEESIDSLVDGDLLSDNVDISSLDNSMTFKFSNKGEYIYTFRSDKETTYTFVVKYKEVDFVALESEINTILGEYSDQFSINIYDFNREVSWDLNLNKIVEPASIAKLPVAMLVMIDIDNGKYTLQDTYPIIDSQKYGYIGNIGSLPEGTEVTLDYYLSNLLSLSDNNAWYILTYFLGGNWEVVNPRIINELGVNPLFLDPPQGTAVGVGKLLKQLYLNEGISSESSEYILRKLEEAGDWAKAGIGLGLPSGIRYFNKIGTLMAGDKYSYQDAAIVYGEYTDYSLVIMNEYVDWDSGVIFLENISRVVYSYLN